MKSSVSGDMERPRSYAVCTDRQMQRMIDYIPSSEMLHWPRTTLAVDFNRAVDIGDVSDRYSVTLCCNCQGFKHSFSCATTESRVSGL